MSNTILTKENFKKLEAWLLTFGFAIFIITLLVNTRGNHNYGSWKFEDYNIKYDFVENFLVPTIVIGTTIYAALMISIIIIEPYYHRTKSIFKTAIFYLLVFVITFLSISICTTYTDAWIFGEKEGIENLESTYNRIFYDTFVLVFVFSAIYLGYFLLKILIGNLIEINFNKNKNQNLINNNNSVKYVAGFFVWLLVFFFLAVGSRTPAIITLIWAIIVPYSAIIMALNIHWLIPSAEVKSFTHSTYFLRTGVVVLCLAMLATAFIAAIKSYNGVQFMSILILVLLWTTLILTPWAWNIYNNSNEKFELEMALGKSDAHLSFLKSQINPHFLFNALNTLYGSALQENAEKTGEGIQKLGDMMRFMLQENVQDKISLIRDLEYINNYIDLQKLRIPNTANITIDTVIDIQLNNLLITPMILIPFIENSFKHGISLNQPSHIKISLHTKGSTLFLDVQNSVHEIKLNDPEQHKSGIGLQNVKQRLALLYPNKHELSIRENAKEFFIHLTLELS